jgi:MinD superfamily P-loop ATPase
MKIVIASGKGGTGKTTIATNLARVIAQTGKQVQYLDCDVEEPNGHIFLKPNIEKTEQVTVPVPDVDLEKCIGCGRCGKICQYSAIVSLKKTVLTFEQLCHSCGGCSRVCPVGAISEKPKVIGLLEQGSTDGVDFVQGRLEIGDVRTPALIKSVKKKIDDKKIAIIDAPPGTSCPVVEAVRDADLVLLVTEPTPFGLNDLKLAVEMVRQLKIPFAAAINRSDIGNDAVMRYCRQENIKVILQIPNDRKIAESYSRGIMILDAVPDYKQKFLNLFEDIISMGKR